MRDYIVPVVRRFFPIWRYRDPKWYPEGPRWYPDPYQDRRFATQKEADAFVDECKRRYACL